MYRDEERRQEVEKLLGKQVDWDQEGTIENLNLTPTALIEDARRLPIQLGYRYLKHFVASSESWHYKGFYARVVCKKQDAKNWRLGRILMPNTSENTMQQLLEGGLPLIKSWLGAEADEKWVTFPQNRPSWQYYQFSLGAPAVIRPELDYHWYSPDEVSGFAFSQRDEFIPISNLTIETRRWIASVIARRALQHELLHDVREPLKLAQRLYPTVRSLSHDAEVAIKALFLELDQFGISEHTTPGYLGPNSWYAGDFEHSGSNREWFRWMGNKWLRRMLDHFGLILTSNRS